MEIFASKDTGRVWDADGSDLTASDVHRQVNAGLFDKTAQVIATDDPDVVRIVPSRRWDGQAETAADTRFFDLRESGYTGWIDQDGYPVTDPDAWIAEQRNRWLGQQAENTDADEM